MKALTYLRLIKAFLSGVARTLDLGARLHRRPRPYTFGPQRFDKPRTWQEDLEVDRRAIESDWKTVQDDFKLGQ